MDSKPDSTTAEEISSLLYKYLQQEWDHVHKDRKREFNQESFPTHEVEVPKQTNSFDCALYLLHSVEKFLCDFPVEAKHITVRYHCLLVIDILIQKVWYSSSELQKKRSEIRSVLLGMSALLHRETIITSSQLTVLIRNKWKQWQVFHMSTLLQLISALLRHPIEQLICNLAVISELPLHEMSEVVAVLMDSKQDCLILANGEETEAYPVHLWIAKVEKV